MKELVPLLAVVGLWFVIATILKRRGWGGVKRNACAGLGAFVGLVVSASIIADPAPVSRSTAVAPANDVGAHKIVASAKSDAELKAEARKARDEKLRRLDKNIVSIDYMESTDAPKVWITLKQDGWNEASTFYGFAVGASSLLKRAVKGNLIEEGRTVVFILRVDMIANDGDGMTKTSQSNILDLVVPANSIAEFVEDSERTSPSALLRLSHVDFRGRRAGREVVSAFCASSRYQGPAGLAPSATFCRQSPSAPQRL